MMTKFERNLAIVIGINHYKNGISPLHTPVNDAEKLAEVLCDKHHYHVWTYLNEDATLDKLKHLLDVELPAEVKESDRLLFYFAGHGYALDRDNPAGYLIPQDAHDKQIFTYLPMTQLQEALERLPCHHFLGILDCCFAGAFRWGSMRDIVAASEQVVYKEKFDRFLRYSAWRVMASARSSETALDRSLATSKHSPFAQALIDGLKDKADCYPPATSARPAGDGIVTGAELHEYVKYRIAELVGDHEQTPLTWSMKKDDGGEYIFFTTEGELQLPPAPDLTAQNNPYRGLESFEEKHKDWFFGRETIKQTLQTFVETHSLTVVLGGSGSGKSSLVKAGLIPKFRAKQGLAWTIALLRPGKTPNQTLNSELQKYNLDRPLLLVIDQAEELITLCRDPSVRQEFLSKLAEVVTNHPTTVRVVLTLRSDFEPQLRDLDLRDNWQTARFPIPMMNRQELREAIEKPAKKQVMDFEPRKLIDDLIDEVVNMPGALPLLSFALSELYLNYLKRQQNSRKRIERSITQADYIKLEGVIISLTKRADEECAKLGKVYESIIQMVMLRMVATGSGELARQRVLMTELAYPPDKAEKVEQVINQFVEARLLIKDQDKDGNDYVEPAHDALVTGWSKLRDWVAAEKNLDLQRRLAPDAIAWKHNASSYLWNADPNLDVLQKEVLNSPDHNWFNQAELEFVQRSIQRKYRNIRLRWTVATSALAIISGISVVTFFQWNQAQRRSSVAFAESARANLLANRSMEGTINAVKAVRLLENPLLRDREIIYTEVADALIWANSEMKEQLRLQGVGELEFSPDGRLIITANNFDEGTRVTLQTITGEEIARWETEDGLSSIEFSPDSKLLVSSPQEGDRQLWDTSGQMIEEFPGVGSIKFSPDSKFFIAYSQENHLQLWDASGQLIEEFSESEEIWGEFSPDSQMLAISDTKTTQLWRTSGELMTECPGEFEQFAEYAVEPQRQEIILITQAADTTKLWRGDGSLIATVPGDFQHIEAEKNMIMTTQADDATRIWNMSGQPISATIPGIFWDLKGTTLLTFDENNTNFYAWNISDKSLQLIDYTEQPQSINLSSDGQFLLTAGIEGDDPVWSVKLWEISKNPITQRFVIDRPYEENPSAANHVWPYFHSDEKTILLLPVGVTSQFPPLVNFLGEPLIEAQPYGSANTDYLVQGSSYIASADENGSIKLWDASGNLITQFNNAQGESPDEKFSPDNQLFATNTTRGTMQLWNLSNYRKTLFPEKQSNSESHPRIEFSTNGQLLAYYTSQSTSQDVLNTASVSLWDISGNSIGQLPMKPEDSINQIKFSPDNQILAVDLADGLKLWDISSHSFTNFQAPPSVFEFSADGQQIITDEEGTINVWDTTSNQLIKAFEVPSEALLTGVNREGEILTVDYSDEQNSVLQFWNTSGELVRSVEVGQELGNATLSPDRSLIVGDLGWGTGEHFVRVWDSSGNLIAAKLLGSLREFSPDGKTLATVDVDAEKGIVYLWNADGTSISKLSGYRSISGFQFSADGQRVAMAHGDGVRSVRDTSGRLIANLPAMQSGIRTARFSPTDSKLLATLGNDNTIKLLRLDDRPTLLQTACTQIAAYLQSPASELEESDRRLCDGIIPSP
ncbi:MAG: hypothetical protein HC881_04155 [Leptolyngbyaceae cyanobacterium SL_7_1]|nr:hypothetical protein [Leptolyngbyaceae cyanobacterium SL_7_1]